MAKHLSNCEGCGSPIFGGVAAGSMVDLGVEEATQTVQRSCPSLCMYSGQFQEDED